MNTISRLLAMAAFGLAASGCGGGGGGDTAGTPSTPTAQISYALSLSPTSITTAETSLLTVTVTNTGSAAGTAAFTLNFPSGATSASSIQSATCSGSTTNTSTSLSLAGANLAASSSCVASIRVQASTPATYTFALSGAVSKQLTVTGAPVIVYSIGFAPTSIAADETTEMTVGVRNDGTVAGSGDFTLTYPSGATNKSGFHTTSCTGTPSATNGGSSMSLSGSSLSPGATCTFTITVGVNDDGNFPFTLGSTTSTLTATVPPPRWRVSVFTEADFTGWQNFRTIYQRGTAPAGLISQQFGTCKAPPQTPYVSFQCLYGGQSSIASNRPWKFIAIHNAASVTLTFGNHVNASVVPSDITLSMTGDLMYLEDAIAVFNQTVYSQHASASCSDGTHTTFKPWRAMSMSKGADDDLTNENAEYRFFSLYGTYTDDIGNNITGRFGSDWGGLNGMTTVLDKASPQYAGIIAVAPKPTIDCGTLAPTATDRFASVYNAFDAALTASGFLSGSATNTGDTTFTFDGFRSQDGLNPSYYADEIIPPQTIRVRTYSVTFNGTKALSDFRNKLLAKFVHPLQGGSIAEASLRMPAASDNVSGGWTFGAGTATTATVKLAIIDRYDDMAVVVSIYPTGQTLGTEATLMSDGKKLSHSRYWDRQLVRATVN